MFDAGLSVITWPAEYGVSGVKSFMISHEGVVYEKDLGTETGAVAEAIQLYDPDSSWSVVDDEAEMAP